MEAYFINAAQYSIVLIISVNIFCIISIIHTSISEWKPQFQALLKIICDFMVAVCEAMVF